MKRLFWSFTFMVVAVLVAMLPNIPKRMSVAPIAEKKVMPPDIPLYSVLYEGPFDAEEIFADCKGPPVRRVRISNTIWHTFDVPKKGEK